MNKAGFCPSFFLTDWHHMRCKNTIKVSSTYWNVLLRIFSNCYNFRTRLISCVMSDLVYFITRVPDTSDTIVTQSTREQHEWHGCHTSATRVKSFDFDNDTSENMFSHPYISYMTNERLQGEEQFHSKNYLL